MFYINGNARNRLEVYTKTHTFRITCDDHKLKVYKLAIINRTSGNKNIFKPQYNKGFKYTNSKLTENDIYILKDVNSDGIKDILIPRNYSDYHLSSNHFCWISDVASDQFVQVDNFEQIEQLDFNSLGYDKITTYSDCKSRTFIKSMETYHIEGFKVLAGSSEREFAVDTSFENSKFSTPDLDDGYGVFKLELEMYNYIFLVDSTNKETYKPSFLLVYNKKNEKLVGINLQMVNVYFGNSIFTSELYEPSDFIKEKDINNDGFSDMIIHGSNWPSSTSVWVFDSRSSSFSEVRNFCNPANIKIKGDKLSYIISIPCGTGNPSREYHTFRIKENSFELEKIKISSYYRKGKNKEEIYRIDKDVRLINGAFKIVDMQESRDFEEEASYK